MIVKTSEMEARGSKTLVASEPMRQPSWTVWLAMKGFRMVLLTLLWTGVGMGAGLFSGILLVAIRGTMQGQMPEMSLAYRHISIPVAITTGSCALLWNLVRTVQAATQRRRELKGR
jgi:hypothetical protein